MQKIISRAYLRICLACVLSLSLYAFFTFVHAQETPMRAVGSSFVYTFNVPGTLLASTASEKSTSPYLWLRSGAKLNIQNGIGETIQGALLKNDPERIEYARVNPLDTANGYYPQNTFRLLTRSGWKNTESTIHFKIVKTNLTATPNRDDYSGIFIEGRYSDQYNLYYLGVRQDGLAVIKKKINGVYYTLAYTQVFGSYKDYEKNGDANLLPEGKWMAIRSHIETRADGSVQLELYLDKNNSGTWTKVVTAVDRGEHGSPLTKGTLMGLRTDYMDMQFDNWEIREL